MKNLNTETFKSEVLDHKGIVVADFYADWCGPCRMLSPLIEEMDTENKDESVKYVKINVDANPQLAGMYNVMSIPTVVFFKDGQVADQKIGLDQKEGYLDVIKSLK